MERGEGARPAHLPRPPVTHQARQSRAMPTRHAHPSLSPVTPNHDGLACPHLRGTHPTHAPRQRRTRRAKPRATCRVTRVVPSRPRPSQPKSSMLTRRAARPKQPAPEQPELSEPPFGVWRAGVAAEPCSQPARLHPRMKSRPGTSSMPPEMRPAQLMGYCPAKPRCRQAAVANPGLGRLVGRRCLGFGGSIGSDSSRLRARLPLRPSRPRSDGRRLVHTHQ